jgi:hypothetical protein
MQHDESESSANIAMWYRDISFSLDELMSYKNIVTKECWRYLMGKYCKIECDKSENGERLPDIYKRLSAIFGCSGANLRRVICYSDAIDHIRKHLPGIAADILDGKTRLQSVEARALLKMKPHDIKEVMARLSNENTPAKTIVREQKQKKPAKRGRPKRIQDETTRISIKDTPTHDPDAQVNALSYTVPSWVSMVERTFDASDFKVVSVNARDRLSIELSKLSATIETINALLNEVAI